MLKQLLLILDVDGVVREGVSSTADEKIIFSIRELLKKEHVEVIFISGTSIHSDYSLEIWRRSNVCLSRVFDQLFVDEIKSEKVTIYGVLGGQKMTAAGGVEIIDAYSLDQTFEIAKLLVYTFLEEVFVHGDSSQQEIAKMIKQKVDCLELRDHHQSLVATPLEFSEVIEIIRSRLDPEFRLISNGSLVETHTSSSLWDTALSMEWLKREFRNPRYKISQLDESQKHVATGLCRRETHSFNFLMISKIDKGVAVKKHIEKKKLLFPEALVVTIGDTQVDYPMHEKADIAFHVGLEKVWKNHPLEHCIMMRNARGEDSQHLNGTLEVLSRLHKELSDDS